MAKDPSKTEKATPKRRAKAREEGQILRVPDLDATILLWGNLFLFAGVWSATFALLGQQVAYFLKRTGDAGHILEQGLQPMAMDLVSIILKILLPFLGMNFLLALAIQLAQHGFHINLKPVSPKFSKLNPIPGFKRLFSARSFMEILKSVLKLLIVGWVAYAVISPRLPKIMGTMLMPLDVTIRMLQETLFVLFRNIMIAMIAIAFLDFMYQRHVFEESLKMSKQEVKDEMRDAEGNPEIKGRQKSLMVSAMMHRISTQVPKATVVVTNPTHFAVALQYDRETSAPICVAKGVDHMALKIREAARKADVPMVENRPLARALYHTVALDKPIPPELYQAVAQIMAYVYRLKGVA